MTKPVEKIEEAPAKAEAPPRHEHKMEFSLIEAVQTRMADEIAGVESGIADLLPADPTDDEIAEAELRDAALDRVAAALVNIGISEADAALAFGIEPAEIRKAKKPKRKDKTPPGRAKKEK
ncbi:MAG: hypothetical protein ACRCYS_16075 [Beijerinckiaceae bacterium]